VDFPISVPSIGLVDGKFIDENPTAGTPGSLIPSAWGNAVTEEILAVIRAAGLAPDENNHAQLLLAVRKIIQSGQLLYALDTGAANLYVAAFSPAVTALADGLLLMIKAKTANTGASTFDVNGLGAKPIVGLSHVALQAGDIAANGDVWLQYNTSIGGGSWVLLQSSSGGTMATTSARGLAKLATSAQMATGTDTSLVPSVAAVMSLFSKRSFGASDYIRIPDVPGGLIINWGTATVNASGDINVNYPLAYSTLQAITIAVSGQNTDAAYLSTGAILGGFTMPFYKTTTGAKSSGGFSAQWISIGR
jgi:hypothetical protein